METGVIVISSTDDPTVVRVNFGEGFASGEITQSFELTRTNARQAQGVAARRRLLGPSDGLVCEALQLDGLAFLRLESQGFCLCVRQATAMPQILGDLIAVIRREEGFCKCRVVAEGSPMLQKVVSTSAPAPSGRRWLSRRHAG